MPLRQAIIRALAGHTMGATVMTLAAALLDEYSASSVYYELGAMISDGLVYADPVDIYDSRLLYNLTEAGRVELYGKVAG
jgi:hypothetical protein